MNQLQKVFNFEKKPVRTLLIDNEPWFVAADVTHVLEIDRTQVRRLDEDEKGVCSIHTPGGLQELTVINEFGLYNLVLGSRKKEAKEFKRWITHEVIPSIRNSGSYNLTSQFAMPTNYIEALEAHLRSEKEKAVLQAQVQVMLPKAEMFDVIASADNSQPMSAVSKSFGIGRNKLFEFLRGQKVLRYNNEPYQTYIDRGYFTVRQIPIARSRGYVDNKTQTLVTAKGIDYIGRLLRDDGLLQTRAVAVSM